ncbi:hypothetical protein [Methylobacterium aquaticum]|uniref:Uncharacterized protein n=1 Tax=Methylobacterium aquaticum TaxID=270351 RepID=A0A0C6FG32_9HYPH|nr:hypothetical protein [Methylobacterium aquaticum]BAQ44014.1 hypothetical protein Maq22A_c02785 [Methylobacterium aquaticum]
MSDSTKAGLRDDIARIVWTVASGNAKSWDRVKDRKVETPNYLDEIAAEAWATADAIMARFQLTPKLSRARAAGIPVQGGDDVG